MNFELRNSIEDLAIVYIQLSNRVVIGFFQQYRAIVLPYLHKDAWCYPDIGLLSSPENVQKLLKLDRDLFEVKDRELSGSVAQALKFYNKKSDLTDANAYFQKHLDEFFGVAGYIFPVISQVNKVIFIACPFGPASTFYRMPVDGNRHNLFITFRDDYSPIVALKGLITQLVTLSYHISEVSEFRDWYHKMAISDFVAFNTPLKDFFRDSDLDRTLSFIEDYKGVLAQESADYLKKLGFSIKANFSYDGDTILFDGTPLLGLEKKEIEVLKLLIEHRSRVVSFDEIADVYWGKDADDKFSMASILKIMEKIRKSFVRHTIPLTYLQTVRKSGYLLYD